MTETRSIQAISLWQPWASLIAHALKPYETRHWSPPIRLHGQRIAIHATARKVPIEDVDWFLGACRKAGITDQRLPLSAVVCTAVLRTARIVYRNQPDGTVELEDGTRFPDDDFGNYAVWRWCWHLVDVEKFDPPIPARGAQGFWSWTPPDA